MTTTPTPIGERLAAAGARILPLLEDLLPRGRDDFLSEPVWHHMDTGGKRIRPALCVLTCEALGGRGDDALPFAAGVELLHNMFLVHDDLEDGDTVRRDRETVWVKFGMPNAVNVGDYLLAVAYEAVVRTPVEPATLAALVREFTETYKTTCRGQAMDINRRARPDLTVEDYLHMVTLKTGRYLALGMAGGAMVAGAGADVVAAIQELSTSMGPAFQIRDDVIDLTAGKGRGGMVGCDIREGKPSILYAHALNAADADQRAFIVDVMARPRGEVTDADVERVTAIYAELGSVEFATAEAERIVARAYDTLERIPVADAGFFRQIVDYMASRTN